MNFDWIEYLNLAKELRGNHITSNQEAKMRSIISRAYYAVFCKSKEYLSKNKNIPIPESKESHEIVRKTFEMLSKKEEKHIATILQRLRQRRNMADYSLSFHIRIYKNI